MRYQTRGQAQQEAGDTWMKLHKLETKIKDIKKDIEAALEICDNKDRIFVYKNILNKLSKF